ncbi:MAG: hypothetical protein MUF18_03795 [Fimbriiglobus sp.]|jgi:hypothetical protein|nr:hypothetical protein [Fimbriiglobus sp.]
MSPSQVGDQPAGAELGNKRVLLDTSIQIDRLKSGHRDAVIRDRIAPYQFRFATSFGQLEFKAVLIETMITIHGALSRKGARFTEVRDRLTESQHPQRALRGHIFNNFLTVSASSRTISEADDLRLAEKARLSLQEHIRECYDWFTESVDSVLREKLRCDRATERPRLKKTTYDVNLPTCKRGVNMNCHVEPLLRSATRLKAALERLASQSSPPGQTGGETANQFRKSLTLIERVENDTTCDLTSGNCRNAGDLLMFLEAEGMADHAMSTNAREWQPLSELFGFDFVTVQYPRPT